MAFEADRVVVELIAKVDNFDQPVKASAQSFDASMAKIAASGAKAEQTVAKSSAARSSALQRESAQISQFSKALARDMDFAGAHMAGPNSPFVVPAREAPKVANALKLVQVGSAAMAGVLGGVAAHAAFALAEAFVELISKGVGANAEIASMVEKLKEHADKTELARRAAAIFAGTLEGVTQALNDNEKALEQLNAEEQTAAERALVNAERAKIRLQQIRDETQALLDQARAHLELQKAQLDRSPGRGFEAKVASLQGNASDIDALEAKLGRVNGQIKRAETQITAALSQVAVETAKALTDPVARINTKYDRLIEQARQRAIAENTVRTTLVKQTAELERQRKAELDAAKTRKAKPPGSSLPPVTGKEIANALGTTITSGTRSAQRNKDVGGAANSYHLSGQAIDIPLTVNGKPLTKDGIRAALAPLGVQIKELLGPGDKGHDDHFHIAFSKKRLGPDQVANAQDRAADAATRAAEQAQRAADAEANRVQAFQNEKANLEGRELEARQALITSAEEIEELEKQAVGIARDKYDDNLQNLVATGKLHADEAAELQKLNDETANLRLDLIERRRRQRIAAERTAALQRSEAVATGQMDAEQELLRSQEQLVTSTRERHDIERRIIDLQFAEEKLRLENQIAIARQVQANKDGAFSAEQIKDAIATEAVARAQLGTIPQRQSNAQTGNDRSNASPLQSYFDSIPNTAGEINDAFEQVAAGGLATFTDALTDAIVNFHSLGDVGRQVLASITAQLVRMAIQQVILHTIGKSLGAASVAATTAEAAAAGAAWAGPAAMASLATLGANAGPAAAALASTTALATVLGAPKAAGGRIFGPGGDTSDRILTPTSADEYVIKARSARSIGYQALDFINDHGRLPDGMGQGMAEGGRIRPTNVTAGMANGGRIRPMNVPAASPGARGGGFSREDIAELRGIIAEALHAMPAVVVHPVIDSGEVFERGISSRHGERAYYAHLNNNSSRVKAAINKP